jgi:hypothetical protein
MRAMLSLGSGSGRGAHVDRLLLGEVDEAGGFGWEDVGRRASGVGVRLGGERIDRKFKGEGWLLSNVRGRQSLTVLLLELIAGRGEVGFEGGCAGSEKGLVEARVGGRGEGRVADRGFELDGWRAGTEEAGRGSIDLVRRSWQRGRRSSGVGDSRGQGVTLSLLMVRLGSWVLVVEGRSTRLREGLGLPGISRGSKGGGGGMMEGRSTGSRGGGDRWLGVGSFIVVRTLLKGVDEVDVAKWLDRERLEVLVRSVLLDRVVGRLLVLVVKLGEVVAWSGRSGVRVVVRVEDGRSGGGGVVGEHADKKQEGRGWGSVVAYVGVTVGREAAQAKKGKRKGQLARSGCKSTIDQLFTRTIAARGDLHIGC